MIPGKFAQGEGARQTVVFEGVGVEEAEVEPPLLVESNKMDCIVGSMMLGREQRMFAAGGLEAEEAASGAVWRREVQGL